MKRLRRSMLFCPANNEKMLKTAHSRGADCVIFDLEDAVAYSEKEDARKLLCRALQTMDYGDCEIFVRINSLNTGFGEDDVRELVKSGVKNIRLPMCESKEDIVELSQMLSYFEKMNNICEGTIKIQGAIETPKGVLNALEIAESNERVVSISFGTGDYTNCLCVDRTKDKEQFLYARSHIAICANIAGIDSADTVFFDIKDKDAFKDETKHAKLLGFTGKSCIHPSQISIVHQVFTPDSKSVEKSLKIMNESKKAAEKGIGVIVIDGKMVDEPVIRKAEKILKLASAAGMTNY